MLNVTGIQPDEALTERNRRKREEAIAWMGDRWILRKRVQRLDAEALSPRIPVHNTKDFEYADFDARR